MTLANSPIYVGKGHQGLTPGRELALGKKLDAESTEGRDYDIETFWAFLLCNNLQVFVFFCNWTACLVCFGLLERKMYLAGLGWTCVAVDNFWFLQHKKKVSYENPCCIQYILFYISCTDFCLSHIKTSRQAGSHLKQIFVKDLPCKTEMRCKKKYINIYINI